MSFLAPDRYLTTVEVIDLADIWRSGVRMILLDRDNTVVPRTTSEVPASVREWIETAKSMGFYVSFISNNHYENVIDDARALGIPLVAKAHKPLPGAIKRTIRDAGLRPEQAMLVGDQLYTDIWGARAAGLFSVLVVPQCKVDLWYSGPLRLLERFLLFNSKPSDSWTPRCLR